MSKPPAGLREKLGITEAEDWLHLLALHVTDDTPYALEDRWISLTTVPMAKQVDFHAHSANEWLLEHVPYTDAALSIRAASADDLAQRHLVVSADAPILQLERVTRLGAALVTAVTLSFPPGHQIVSSAGSA
ncbi:MAG: UTRA domain-containing protein [Pseudomonadota bacterium]